MTRTAHCSCGALRVEVSADPDVVGICHCGECQRRTGSVFSVSAFFKKEHVRAEGPSNIYVRDGQEGRKVRMHFCPTCDRPRCLGPDGDHRPLDGSAGAAGYRSDRSNEGHEFACNEIPRIRGVPDAETGGNRCLPCASKGDFHPRLLERVWTLGSRHGLSRRMTKKCRGTTHALPY